MSREPALCGAPEATALLGGDHLERMPEGVRLLPLDLAEDEPAAAADDQVELVPARPDVLAEDPVAPQAIVERGTALEPVADPPRAQAADARSEVS